MQALFRTRAIDSPKSGQKITIHFYRPDNAGKDEKTPVVYYCHGGGYQTGNATMYGNDFREMCNRLGATVFSVEYTLPIDPSYTYHIELDEAYAGLAYIHEHADELHVDGDNIVIMTVFDDTPAAEAGIMPEDIIEKVDGKKPADVDDAVQMITGEAGTKVTLTIKRGDETIDFDLNRQKIETDSVAYDTVKDHPEIGYIVISSFIKGTDDDFKMAVKDLKAKGCTKFIIDLRDNGGGLTESSIEIADYLLPACKIMSENTKDGSETVYNSKASSADLDMVILVNGNTASASEILAAALQDNKAGVVIGTKTYGKGVTQMMRKFSDGTAVKITVTEYFRPNGETVNGVGITPDIEAEGEEVLEEALRELAQ